MKKHLNTRGSIWRKWDLHIHAPGTALNDLFKNDWDSYIEKLADLNDISVLGITDYYGLEGYMKVKEAKKQGKLNNIDLIIPNIEMRLDAATKGGNPINYHILFSPEVDEYIQNYFLNELEFNYAQKKYKCIKDDLIELGENFSDKKQSEEENYKQGIMQFKISINDVIQILEKHKSRFKGKYLLGLPNSSNDGGSGIRVEQYQGIKENIYKNSHIIFSSNPKDKVFFSNESEATIKLAGKRMPCIHGSDAHEIKKIGNPNLDRFTWVKADPTWNGLLQIIHEPESRVVVQPNHPDSKTPYNVIDKVQFLNENDEFTTKPIYFNPDLNVIIGGKSSGKSALLYKIAQAISLEEINKSNENWTNIYKDTFIDKAEFKVTFQNDEVFTKENSNGRVQYIPQMYINKMSEDRNNQVLQNKIKEILESNISNTEDFLEANERIEQIELETRTQLDLLIDQIYVVLNTKKNLNELPSEKEVSKEIQEIEEKINKAIETAKLTDEEAKKYEENIKKVKVKETELIDNEAENNKHLLNVEEFTSIISHAIRDIKKIDFKEENTKDIFKNFMFTLEKSKNSTIEELEKISKQYKSEKELIKKELNQLISNNSPIDKKLQQSNTIPEDQTKLKEQQLVLKKIKEAKQNLEKTEKTQEEIETKLFNLKDEEMNNLLEIQELIKATKISNNLTAEAKINFSNNKFDEKFLDLFQRRGKINNILTNTENEVINDEDEFNYSEQTYIDNIKHLYNIILNTSEEDLRLKRNSNKRNLLEALLKETYIDLQYDLVKDNDSLYQMSPGNRGLVLLELFLHMSNELYPILIDQPEDNLDNRTISKELVKIIREQKNKRQIIIVTHNANLAVLTDAENIIVANQDHTLEYNTEARFEYITGSLECSFFENNGYKFYDQGIKEHTSEILEGGEEAFEVRGRKYGYNE